MFTLTQVKQFTTTYHININSSRLSCTALSTAIYHGNEQIIEHLLQYGADVNQLSADKQHERIESPLMTACRMGYTKIAQLLLQYGAHTHIADWYVVFIEFKPFKHSQFQSITPLDMCSSAIQ
jgi:ankyrin repeat protein